MALPTVTPGELITSTAWNNMIAEIDKKLDKSGGTMTGPLSIGTSTNISFGSQVRQMLNLWGTEYAIGVQSSTQYFRSFGNFAWYRGGTHNDAALNAGGGSRLMSLDTGGSLSIAGALEFIPGAGQNRMHIERGLMSFGGFIPIGGGPDPNNLMISCADVNSGTTPTYKFAVGHWVRTQGGPGPGGIFVLGSSDFNASLVVSSNGRVGMGGITSPATALHVKGDYIRVDGLGNEQAYIGGDGAGSDVQVGSTRNGITNIVMYNTVTGMMNLFANQGFKPGGGSWAASSDERLKKNVKSLDNVLDKLLKLRGVSFEYKDADRRDYLAGKQIGMIAQEVEKVFPQWVTEGRDGFKAVGIMGFEALVVEALREIKSELDLLKGQLGIESKTAAKPKKSTTK